MDYDFITTCNWTATGTYTLRAYRGSSADVVTTHYASIHYRKKGTTTWSALNSSGQISITSTGEWEIGNDWNKSGNDCLTHSYYNITAIDKCTKVEFDETALGTNCGNYFLVNCWYGCTSLTSMPVGFNLPTGITTAAYSFLYETWKNCSKLTSMPSGFNLPTGITTAGDSFLYGCWAGCSSLTSMPSGFNIPSGLTTIGGNFLRYCWAGCSSLTSMPSGFNIPSGLTTVGNYFIYSCWQGCTSLTSMPVGFNLPTGITTVGSDFLSYCWYNCTSLTSMPSGFNIPSGLTTVGSRFLSSCWYNCKALDDDDYTEDITFEFNSTAPFGGTCTLYPTGNVTASKATPVNVAVNRSVEPTVTTQACTNITLSSISGNGNITDIGTATPTVRGFCYIKASTGDPTTSDSKVSTIGTYSTGSFSISITSLDADSDYRVRAYAINSVGTSYGDTVSVSTTSAEPTVTTQACTDVSYYSVTGNGNITNIGGTTPTVRGFCYIQASSGDPTTSDSTVSTTGSYTTGAFTGSLTSLTTNTAYRVRAYAINSFGTGYGDTVDVTTEELIAPTVTTQACTNVDIYSITGNGNITAIGSFNPTIRGFCYLQGTSGTPTTADSIVSTTGTYSTGAFSMSITGLTAFTSYRIRAYATNSAGTSYGDTVDVTTEQSVMPTVPPTISFTNRDKITSTWGQLRQFFYKSWLFGSRNVKFGSIGYTFGGTNIKEEQKFSNRDKITTKWK